ncbi:hypothetical protein BCR44DRAFT_40355, partial [Catenaria anguillulae PL171]
MKPTTTQHPTFLFTATPLPAPTYASLTHLLPHLTSLAPLAIESWATAMHPDGAPAIVHLYLYHRGSLPPPPSYVPTTPTGATYPIVDGQAQAQAQALPDEAGLIAQITFVAHNGAPMLVSGSPVLGPGAPQLASPPPVMLGPQLAQAVSLVGEWIAGLALANGHAVPWMYGGGTPASGAACAHHQGATTGATESTALLSAAQEENRRLRRERKALCFLCLLCCCC